MKNLKLLALLSLSTYAMTAETVKLTDPFQVYKALFAERHELRDKDCHRMVFESRSPRTMIAMGCKLTELEIGPLVEGATHRWFKGTYQCETGDYPFTANCYLK